jgi:hypothetical protein
VASEVVGKVVSGVPVVDEAAGGLVAGVAGGAVWVQER